MKSFFTACFIVLIMLCSFKSNAQQFAIGTSLGGGYISGDSPEIGSYTISMFLDTYVFSKAVFPRISFIYAGDFETILPSTREAHSPFMKGVSLKGILSQEYQDNYFMEGGAGVIYLNDRTFASTNSSNVGLALSISAGINFAKLSASGFKAAIGTEYAFAFGGTFPKLFSLHLQGRYVF